MLASEIEGDGDGFGARAVDGEDELPNISLRRTGAPAVDWQNELRNEPLGANNGAIFTLVGASGAASLDIAGTSTATCVSAVGIPFSSLLSKVMRPVWI